MSVQGDIMLYINKQLQSCDVCKCNVFRHPEGDPHRYRCNSCGAIYCGWLDETPAQPLPGTEKP